MNNVEFPLEYKYQDIMVVAMTSKVYEKLESRVHQAMQAIGVEQSEFKIRLPKNSNLYDLYYLINKDT